MAPLRLSRLPSCSIALSIKPTCDSTVAKSCKSETASAYDFPNNRMSSAKRRSSSAGWLSPKSNPLNGASRLQPFIAHCGTAENKRGLKTHPYLTPEAMGKLRLDPHLPWHALLRIGLHTVSTASICAQCRRSCHMHTAKCLWKIQTDHSNGYSVRCRFVRKQICCKQVLFNSIFWAESMLFFGLMGVKCMLDTRKNAICKSLVQQSEVGN